MGLVAGQRLGAYEVVSPLGAGGMGEVYRAHDTRLLRDVAIKILPESFAGDRDRLARFEREAQVVAALNHPNIAAIYGLEQSGESHVLVLELVEGETLAELIARGPLATPDALAIATQIADALQAAHDKGIIHRDLKPANIALTADRQVKVLDFGLAKAMETTPAGASIGPGTATLSPTMSLAMTQAGMILGTAAYMSPEQAKGKPADKRSDVWAFGCVLFEMLTGKRAFEGEDASDTLAAVLRGEPEWTAVPRATPPHVRTILRGCLEKDRKTRLADISVVNYLLREPARGKAAPAALGRRGWAAVGMTALAVGALAAITTWLLRPPPGVSPLMRFGIVIPVDVSLSPTTTDRQLAISPDGTHIVYVTPQGLALRAIDRMEIVRLGSAPPNARAPFWSPDGKWIAYAVGNLDIQKVSVTGGPAVTLVRTGAPPRGGTWGDDDTIVFATNDGSTGLLSVPAGGGDPTVLTKPDAARGEGDHLFPSFLPGSRAVLFTIASQSSPDNSQIAVYNRDTATSHTLIRGGSHAEYVQTGHLLYAVSGTLRAVRFDLDTLEVVGDPVPVLEQMATVGNGAAQYSVSKTGILTYVPGGAGGTAAQRSLVWVDRAGQETAINAPARAYQFPRLSPDGTRIAVSIGDQQNDIWVFDLARQILTPLTFEPSIDQQPVWHPDGQQILFSSARGGPTQIFVQRADGTGSARPLTGGTSNHFTPSISPDGALMAMLEQFPKTGNDVTLLRLRDDAARVTPQPGPVEKTEPLFQTSFNEVQPEISPDGRWIAYSSDNAGQPQVYVHPFPNVDGGRWQVSTGTGTRPAWSANGRELFYATPTGAIMAVPVKSEATFSYGNAVKLFDWPTIAVPGLGRTYDVSRDGKRFLMIKEGNDTGRDGPQSTITVVLNWHDELKRLVPVP